MTAMDALFPDLTPQTHRPHRLHGPERVWPETNCYVDLWIEILNALGLPPEAMLGFTLGQDFEGDQFTFFKPSPEDLETLFGVRVQELAIFDRVESHVLEQLARGRLCLLEVDSFHLPDTSGVSYGVEHGKTTIAVNRLDLEGRRLEYFHNGGYFVLGDDDFTGLFDPVSPDRPFLPYTEFVKLEVQRLAARDLRARAWALFKRNLLRRPTSNPVRAFQRVVEVRAAALLDRPFDAFHKFAFNTYRQLGANFELLGDHLVWLEGGDGPSALACRALAEGAKTAQFQLARGLSRRRIEGLASGLDPLAEAYDQLFDALVYRKAA